MIENEQLLGQAKKVLKLETLRMVTKSPFRTQGWKILDRWAVASPRRLVELESEGEMQFCNRLLEQQEREIEVLSQFPNPSLAEHEILDLHEVEMRL